MGEPSRGCEDDHHTRPHPHTFPIPIAHPPTVESPTRMRYFLEPGSIEVEERELWC